MYNCRKLKLGYNRITDTYYEFKRDGRVVLTIHNEHNNGVYSLGYSKNLDTFFFVTCGEVYIETYSLGWGVVLYDRRN
jgi:uncharacterized protein YkuJ